MMLLAALFLLPPSGRAQTPRPTNVDKLISALDTLTVISYDHWKVSNDLKNPKSVPGDPSLVDYDDAKWDSVTLDQHLMLDSCWFRKTITIPKTFLGKPVSGPVKFLTSIDDYGYLWVNGKSYGYFPWDGEFEIAKDVQPGQQFQITIKAINTGGPLRIIRAQIQLENFQKTRDEISDLELSLRTGQKLLSFDTYQENAHKKVDPKIDKSVMDKADKAKLGADLQSIAASIDINALTGGSLEKFQSSIDAAKVSLKPIGAYAKRFTLYFDANAHIDAAWLWRDLETKEVCKNTFGSVLKMMDAKPDFTYTQSAAAYFDWMETLYPEVYAGIKKRVADGRWEVVGGMWVEPDCNLPEGESWMRHLLYSKRYFQSKLGADVKIGWNPDSFGYNWNAPEFYQNAGIDAFVTQKMGWSEHNVFPYRTFWWQAPDSSRVLCYFPFDYSTEVDDPYQLTDWMRQYEANTGFTKLMILFGVGDHGGGPTDEMLSRIEHLKTLDVYPTIEYGTAQKYLDWLKAQDLSKLPVWNNELYLEYHQGTYTTQANMKKSNRRDEALLTNAEKFSTISTMFGGTYHSADMEEAWRKVLFNQFHDLLPGSGIRPNYIDAAEKYKAAELIGNHELNTSLSFIASRVNTSSIKKGWPVMVYNPLSWTRSDIVTFHLPQMTDKYAVFDSRGKEIPSQIVPVDKYHQDILFRAVDVPSIGYSLYELREVKPAATSATLKSSPSGLENDFFLLTVDSATGWVKSIVDKRNGKEILTGSGDELQMLEDKPAEWDAWNIGLTGKSYPWKVRSVTVAENGPVRVVLRVKRDFLKTGIVKDAPTFDYPNSFCTQDIILYNGVDRVDFKTDTDWWEEHVMLKVAFPVTVSDSVATYEIPYGSIRRSTGYGNSWDSAKVEVPAEKWADISSGDYGVSLINNSKYGYDIKGSLMRLSLLRSPIWPDPTADRGKHSIEYELYPHAGTWKEAHTVQRAAEFNNPLIAQFGQGDESEGGNKKYVSTLSASKSFATIAPDNLVLTTIKKAEDGDAWVYQWYDATGAGGSAHLTLPKTPMKVVTSNFLEADGAPLKFSGASVDVPTRKNSVVTIKVYF
jgi:alpha-mannosidase